MNHILSALPRADARWLLPRLKPVQLKARDELETSNQPVKRVFFIETGIAAVVSNSGKARIALGLIGCEGSSAVAVMLGDTRSPHSTVMLNDGTALSLPKSAHSMLWLPVVIPAITFGGEAPVVRSQRGPGLLLMQNALLSSLLTV
jgi:hypothetical protein